MTNFQMGLQLMAYGLAGVFVMLLLSFLIIKGMVMLSNRRPEQPKE